jgi:hypothetical protein
MSGKPVADHKGSKPAQGKDKSHKPAKHIEEIARLASSVHPDKNPKRLAKQAKAAERMIDEFELKKGNRTQSFGPLQKRQVQPRHQ